MWSLCLSLLLTKIIISFCEMTFIRMDYFHCLKIRQMCIFCLLHFDLSGCCIIIWHGSSLKMSRKCKNDKDSAHLWRARIRREQKSGTGDKFCEKPTTLTFTLNLETKINSGHLILSASAAKKP